MKNLAFIILLTTSFVYAQTDEKETLRQLNQKVIASYQAQRYDDALKFAEQVLDLTVKVFGAQDLQTASAYKNLGIIHREKTKFKEAIVNLQKALEIYQSRTETDGRELVKTYEALASAYFFSDKEKEAEANYLKSLEASEKTFGAGGKESLMPLSALAIFYVRTNDSEKGSDYFLKSYALAIKHFGRDSKELEMLRIYEKYYSHDKLWTENKDQLKKFKEKTFALFGYELGDATSLIRPAYTNRGNRGRIVVKVWVNEEGNVTDAKAVYGVMAFAADCEEAARKAKFKPSYMNGKPISVVNYIAYNFVN